MSCLGGQSEDPALERGPRQIATRIRLEAHLPLHILVHPQVHEDGGPLHPAEITFPVVALDPRLGGAEQGGYRSPHGPQLLGDAQVCLLRPRLLLLYRGSGLRVFVVLVELGVVVVRADHLLLRVVLPKRGQGSGILSGPCVRHQPDIAEACDHFGAYRAGQDLDLDLDADLPEVVHGDLVIAEVEELVVTVPGSEANAVRAARIPSLIQQLLGRLGSIPVVLLDLIGPLFEREPILQHRWPIGPDGLASPHPCI